MYETIISSFDGTQLYMKKETAPDNKAVVVIVHGLCEHQGRYDYFSMPPATAPIALTTGVMAAPRVSCPTTALSTKSWTTPM